MAFVAVLHFVGRWKTCWSLSNVCFPYGMMIKAAPCFLPPTACDGYFCDHYKHDQCCCCCCCSFHHHLKAYGIQFVESSILSGWSIFLTQKNPPPSQRDDRNPMKNQSDTQRIIFGLVVNCTTTGGMFVKLYCGSIIGIWILLEMGFPHGVRRIPEFQNNKD